HIISANSFLLNWLTWWIGDAMGILIFTPMILILYGANKSLWRPRIIPILLPLLLSFTVSMTIYYFMNETELKRIRANFSQRVSNDLLEIANDLLKYTQINEVSITNQTIVANEHFYQKRDYSYIQIYNIN